MSVVVTIDKATSTVRSLMAETQTDSKAVWLLMSIFGTLFTLMLGAVITFTSSKMENLEVRMRGDEVAIAKMELTIRNIEAILVTHKDIQSKMYDITKQMDILTDRYRRVSEQVLALSAKIDRLTGDYKKPENMPEFKYDNGR